MSVGFDTREVEFSDLMGKELSITVNYEDYLGNTGTPKTLAWEVLTIIKEETAVEIDDLFLFHPDITDYCADLESTMCDNVKKNLKVDIASLLSVDGERIDSMTVQPGLPGKGTTVSFSFTPAVNDQEPAWSLARTF